MVGSSGLDGGSGGGENDNHHLSRQLIDYLMGETDGVPKDAKYLFRQVFQAFFEKSGSAAGFIAVKNISQNI